MVTLQTHAPRPSDMSQHTATHFLPNTYNRPSNVRTTNSQSFGTPFNIPSSGLFCKYCKRTGHLISECRTRQYNNTQPTTSYTPNGTYRIQTNSFMPTSQHRPNYGAYNDSYTPRGMTISELFCTYCKRTGHLINGCRVRANNTEDLPHVFTGKTNKDYQADCQTRNTQTNRPQYNQPRNQPQTYNQKAPPQDMRNTQKPKPNQNFVNRSI